LHLCGGPHRCNCTKPLRGSRADAVDDRLDDASAGLRTTAELRGEPKLIADATVGARPIDLDHRVPVASRSLSAAG
jgi:hypothetical protein